MSSSGEHAVRTAQGPRGPGIVTQDGLALVPKLRANSRGSATQELNGAAFLDESSVILSLTEKTDNGAVTAFFQCSTTDGACKHVGDAVPARATDGAFVLVHECRDGGRGGSVGQFS
jgi:hypothetical protein